MVDIAGRKAGQLGKAFEEAVAAMLVAHGYSFFQPDRSDRYVLARSVQPLNRLQALGGSRCFGRQLQIFDNLYGRPMKSDFVVFDAERFPHGLIIECKWQGTGGSVEEKYPFTVLSLKNTAVASSLLVLDGQGYRDSVVTWIRAQETEYFSFCHGLGEFQGWAKKHLAQ